MSYKQKKWRNGEVITEGDLNNIEKGIKAVEENIPSKTSDLTNDNGFISTITINGKTYISINGNVTLPDYPENTILVSPNGSKYKIIVSDTGSLSAKLIESPVIPDPVTYTITNNLTNCSNSNLATTINEGESYSASITANSGYTLNTVIVTMNGVDITSRVYSNGVINILNVTGNIVITASATVTQVVPTTYTITNNLTNCSNSNSVTSINGGESYSATITADNGYTLSSVTVTMGGVDITSSSYSNRVITISSATGDIVITASAVLETTPDEPSASDSEEYATYMAEMNDNFTANQEYAKEDEAGAYVIPLSTYNISNNGTNANATTLGINNAIKYAKNNGYSKVKLPEGTYLIDSTVTNSNVLTGSTGNTWTHNIKGVYVPSDITFIMEGATLKLNPVEDPLANVMNLSKSDNAKVIGGTIIGDREDHDYGMRINNTGGEFERGGINAAGANVEEADCIRTKDYITNYVDWFSKSTEALPSEFHIIPLWNTTRNTVDGSELTIYFYNNSNALVSKVDTDFATKVTLPSGATKMKIVIKQETRLDAVIAITKRDVHFTYESACGLCITASNNVTIRGVKVYDCAGDCIGTDAPPIDTALCNDLLIENCTLENARRQGISFVATGDRPIVRNCNIGKINGVDPQCGIDFEHYDHVDGGIIEGCNFYDNKKWDIVNYNGTNLTTRNNYFNGAMGFTYGYNMEVSNNKFLFKDNRTDNIHKSYNEVLYFNQWGQFDDKDAFFNVHDNVFIGYNAGYNNTAPLTNVNNHYKNNTFIDCNWLRMEYTESNTFKNCTIEYIFTTDKTLDASTFKNCTLYRRPGCALNTSNCTLDNSRVVELTSTNTAPTGINIPATYTIAQGESKTLPMMIMPTTALSDGEPLTKEVRWESSDWDKVYVSEIGTIHAIGNPDGVVITCTSRVDSAVKSTCILNAGEATEPVEPVPPTTTYTITNNLTNCTTSNLATSISKNGSYSATIAAKSGYTLGAVTVTMGGTNITNTAYSNGTITIASVTGNIVITGNATVTQVDKDTYTVTNNLMNCSSSNSNTSVNKGYSYLATITPDSGYTVSSIIVIMGNTNISSSVVSGNNINIPSVTGNVIIRVYTNATSVVAAEYYCETDPSTLSYDATTLPQITHFYYPGKQKVSSNETIIPIYFTDWYQREYYFDDNTLDFDIRVEVDGNVKWVRGLKAGEHEISLGVLGVGEHEYNLEVTQVGAGLRSQRLFNRVWIVDSSNDITAAQTHQITSTDLANHNITLGLGSSATETQMTNNRHGMTSLLAAMHEQGYRKVIFPANSVIRINTPAVSTGGADSDTLYKQECIIIPTDMTVDLNNSTIKLHPFDDRQFKGLGITYSIMVCFNDCIDSHLINGVLEGDYFERKTMQWTETGDDGQQVTTTAIGNGNGEHNSCISMNGGRYNTLDNITIQKVTGYNLQCEKSPNVLGHPPAQGVNMQNDWGDNKGCWDNGQGVDLIHGVEVATPNRLTSSYVDLSPLLKDTRYFSPGCYLSGFPNGFYYEVKCTYYDENKNYIDDYNAYQARNAKVPDGAKYIRCTVNASSYSADMSNKPFFLVNEMYSEYNEWNNVKFIDNATCCNPNRFKHLRIYNAKFWRCGEYITPLVIDAEDGDATMQDLFTEHCSVEEAGKGGDYLSVGGLNVVFQNNTNMNWGIGKEVTGATIRNNVSRTNTTAAPNNIAAGWRTRNTVRVYNNDYVYKPFHCDGDNTTDINVKAKNCSHMQTFNGFNTAKYKGDIVLEGCKDLALGCNTYYKSSIFYLDHSSASQCNGDNCTNGCVFNDCDFKQEGSTTTTYDIKPFNYGDHTDNIGEFRACRFDVGASTINFKNFLDGDFTKGKFTNCTFNSLVKLTLKTANTMGDIIFTNCTFNKAITIDLTNTKVKFVGCTFNGINYVNNGEANTQIN